MTNIEPYFAKVANNRFGRLERIRESGRLEMPITLPGHKIVMDL